MLKTFKVVLLVVSCLGFAGAVAGAQEVIHAMTGTIRAIDAADKSFTLFRDSGSLITFKDATGSKTRAANASKILSDATAASAYDKKDAYVIVFYYGVSDNPTALAVRALGSGPFTATIGTVADFSDKARVILVKDDSGAVHEYKIDANTIAESDFGVVEGFKIHADKGGHVRVVGAVTSSNPTALFLNLM